MCKESGLDEKHLASLKATLSSSERTKCNKLSVYDRHMVSSRQYEHLH